MADYYIAQGDTASTMPDVLRDSAGDPVAINGATVKLTVTPLRGGAPIVNDVTVDNLDDGSPANKGRVSFDWADVAGSTDDAGTFLGQWTVTFAGGETLSFPNTGYLLIEIIGDPAQAPGRYLTLEELKKTLKLSGLSFVDRDAEVAIAAAADALDEHYAGPWTLTAGNETRLFTPVHKKSLITLRPQLVSVVDARLDTGGNGAYDTTLVRGTDFELELNGSSPASGPWNGLRILRSGIGWTWEYAPFRNPYPWGVDSLKINGVWGWAEVPAGVKTASSIIATRLIRRLREAPFGLVGLGPEGVSVRAGSIARDSEIVTVMRGAAGKGPGPKRTLVV